MKPENPFAGMRPPEPPAGLRERVLRAAANATGTGEIGPTIWDRLWESRGLRAAWGAAVVLLLLAHATVGQVPRTLHRETSGSAASLEPDPELAEALRLERIEISPRAEAIALGRRKPTRRIDS